MRRDGAERDAGTSERLAAARARFRALYDAHEPAVLGYLVRRVPEPADAADIVAETFVVAWRRIGDVPHGGERPWLFAVARRLLANHRRSTSRRSRLAERLREDLARQRPDPAAELVSEVRDALARLPAKDREIVLLVGWDGLSPSEAATVLGIPPGTGRSRLFRARHRLSALLERDPGLPDRTATRGADMTPVTAPVVADGRRPE